MDGVIDSMLGFVQTNREYAFWIALLLAVAETTAFVSILIPSTAILVGVGALVATGQLSMLPIWAGAAIGAIMQESNLKECWEETDDFQAWKAEVEDLRTRLKRKD